jgi:hypothetical protein
MGTQAQCTTSGSVDRTILLTLNRGGTSLAGIGWTQVLLSVDRLSRSAKVSRNPVRPCEYRISIAGLLRR